MISKFKKINLSALGLLVGLNALSYSQQAISAGSREIRPGAARELETKHQAELAAKVSAVDAGLVNGASGAELRAVDVLSLMSSPNERKTIRGIFSKNGSLLNDLNLSQAGSAIALSGDGRFLAVGLKNGLIAIVNKDLGQIVMRFEYHRKDISALKFIPGTYLLVSGSKDNQAVVWNVSERGRKSLIISAPSTIDGIDISPDQNYILLVSKSGIVSVVDSQIGSNVVTLVHRSDVPSVQLSPLASAYFELDSRHVVTVAEDGSKRVFNLKARLWE
jgi:WD40 repeat protein